MLQPEAEAPWDLLAKHLAGEATPGELEQLRRWVSADPSAWACLPTLPGPGSGPAPLPWLASLPTPMWKPPGNGSGPR
ncbi:hypothetical protein [Hymenobacter cellulosilyticus]|uniref:Uncharacterized protein n=1 Tax=Hymenobacter cellulosilyticus TaxID=2932248 RepID=A0A8T9QDC2_9BACT|nr:hypothetical protein [Hymenobacter cellulosilyticus]UOQ73830.1 hypothetical protein MUN79_07930 [Hymenobacter cellulosilyticus]